MIAISVESALIVGAAIYRLMPASQYLVGVGGAYFFLEGRGL